VVSFMGLLKLMASYRSNRRRESIKILIRRPE